MFDQEPNTNEVPLRICDFCGKGFTSGKALGGHRRSHIVQARKEMGLKKPETKGKSNNGESNTNEASQPVKCPVCNKEFDKWKSVFGHMRSHPERNWRGLDPPDNDSKKHKNPGLISSDGTSSSCFEDLEEEDDRNIIMKSENINLSNELKRGWSKTGERGKRSTLGPIAEAAHCLMGLSRSSCPADLRALIEKNRNLHFLSPPLKKMKKAWDGVDLEGEDYKRNPRSLLRGGDKNPIKDDRVDVYKCKDCDKIFSSFQALGGHRSSHNANKVSSSPKVSASSSRKSSSSDEYSSEDQKLFEFDLNLPACEMEP
ncbi:hypothetical protein UlMin_002870 [Ulmus minor]